MEKQKLTISLTGYGNRKLEAVIDMTDIQNNFNKFGHDVVKNQIYDIFKQLIERAKTT